MTGANYCTGWLNDIDLMYFTEVDPLWNDDELTSHINPEAIVYGNPIAQALCSADCAASAGYPLNDLFWCAGCWGSLYLTRETPGLRDLRSEQAALLLRSFWPD